MGAKVRVFRHEALWMRKVYEFRRDSPRRPAASGQERGWLLWRLGWCLHAQATRNVMTTIPALECQRALQAHMHSA